VWGEYSKFQGQVIFLVLCMDWNDKTRHITCYMHLTCSRSIKFNFQLFVLLFKIVMEQADMQQYNAGVMTLLTTNEVSKFWNFSTVVWSDQGEYSCHHPVCDGSRFSRKHISPFSYTARTDNPHTAVSDEMFAISRNVSYDSSSSSGNWL